MDELLYYPYINLPKSDWTYKAVLYYDKVNVVSVESLKQESEEYTRFNHELFEYGLLSRVYPSEIQGLNIYSVQMEVIKLLNADTEALRIKQNSFKNGEVAKARVFKEKFSDEIFGYLKEHNLCSKKAKDGLYLVESSVANLMMSQLASAIAQCKKSIVSTDNVVDLDTLIFNTRKEKKEDLKKVILNNVMPYPQDFSTLQLLNFKEQNQNDLYVLKEAINEISRQLSITEQEFVIEETKRRIAEIQSEIDLITAKLGESKCKKIILGSAVPTIVAITTASVFNPIGPVVSWILGTAERATTVLNENVESKYRYVALLNNEIERVDHVKTV